MANFLSDELQALYNQVQKSVNLNPMSATVHSYIRFSSKPQEQGDSIRRQTEATENWAKSKGLKLSSLRFEDLGVSGYKKDVKRQGMEALLSAIEAGDIASGDWIALERLDRFGRQGINTTQSQLQEILSKGVNIVCISEGLELEKSSLNDLVKVIQVALYADIAHKQSLEKSQRVSAAKQSQREQAKQGKVVKRRLPLWLKRVGDKYEFNEHLPVVQLIVKLRQQGRGWHGIARDLNVAGYHPRMATHWKDNSVVAIVSNPALYGAYQTGRTVAGKHVKDPTVISDYYPPVISYREWTAIQQDKVNRAGGKTKSNPISGIVKCSCGASMMLKTSTKKTKTRAIEYRHWICRNSADGACEFGRGIRDLDLLITKACGRLQFKIPAKVRNESNKARQKLDDLRTRYKQINELMTNPECQLPFDDLAVMAQTVQNQMALEQKKIVDTADIKEEIQELRNITDPVQYNIKLKSLVHSIIVTQHSKKIFHISIRQNNGHLINTTVIKTSERAKCKIFHSDTWQRIDSYDPREDWEKIIDDDDNELLPDDF